MIRDKRKPSTFVFRSYLLVRWWTTCWIWLIRSAIFLWGLGGDQNGAKGQTLEFFFESLLHGSIREFKPSRCEYMSLSPKCCHIWKYICYCARQTHLSHLLLLFAYNRTLFVCNSFDHFLIPLLVLMYINSWHTTFPLFLMGFKYIE